MRDERGSVDFAALAGEVLDPAQEWGQEDFVVWGGWCTEDDLLDLMQDWPECDVAMPYRIWEYAYEVVFEEKTLPADAPSLLRGRLFGQGGDLSLRREGHRLHWHFVGPAGTRPPAGDYHAQDFWQYATAGAVFHRRVQRALLWGERRQGFDLWFEDRTARARLAYPLEQLGRAQVKYSTFSRGGQVQFVWLLGLEAYDG
jgi:hypothetical protein